MVGWVQGSTQLSIFDMSQGQLDAVSTYQFKTGLKGLCLARKSGVDIYSCEINRVLGLNEKCIEPVTMTVPRKNPGFHIELYPPTASPTPALTADAWFKGGNESPKLYQITDKVADAREAKAAVVEATKQQEAVDKKTDARTYKATTTRRALEQVFSNSVFKHTK